MREFKEAIVKGAKFLQNGKIVSDYGHLRIVFKKLNNKVFVITVMIRKDEKFGEVYGLKKGNKCCSLPGR